METIFALDIGTRKIAGLVMQKGQHGLEVLAGEMMEHNTRAMLDGQIHDVEAVTSAIQNIRNTLEEKLQLKLDKVAVAAAGRALKTSRGSVHKNRQAISEIIRDEVRALEIEAVQEAQYLLAQEELGNRDKNNYYCVGYSVVTYYLDGQPIGNLVGQIGSQISVEVIATFLPRVVIDSLFSSLKKAGLDIYSLTLEPIAALSVAIPPEMRLLNLALVDIGAGTSDIAIVRDGSIFAYAMVPIGGDEVTEVIATQYLLDFNGAEALKRQLNQKEQITFIDILGNETSTTVKEVEQELQVIITDLARSIAENILNLNQKAPDAVVCVGGGSLTPGLTVALADQLNLAARRVGLRTAENFSRIKTESAFLKGPQGVTPLGIAYHCFTKPPVPFITVKVNQRNVALWNAGQINVGSALLSSGISLFNIYGKPGLGKTIEINGVVKIFKGEMGTAPVIKINGQPASLETLVHEGDDIEFVRGTDGKDAVVRISDLVTTTSGYVLVNSQEVKLKPAVMVNGKVSDLDEEIPDRAQVEIKQVTDLENVLLCAGVDEHLIGETTYHYFLDNQPMELKWSALEVLINGTKADWNQTVEPGAQVDYTYNLARPCLKQVFDHADIRIRVRVNGQVIALKSNYYATMNGKPARLQDELVPGAKIFIDQEKSEAIVSDIFQVIDIEPLPHKKLVINVNGEPAGFTTPIYNKSEIELLWK